jgi:peptidyl-tRNA hydrolase, PTH1 family
MSLFDKKTDYSTGAPLYTLGANKTVLIVGLGNPGDDYTGTRHNVGFEVLDQFAKVNDFPAWTNKKDLKCLLSTHQLTDTRVILCKPTTFMNLSGEAAHAVQHFYKVYNAQTLVVYDELALPFGSLRTRAEGSDAGHNGVKSLIQQLGEDFGRLRIGISSDKAKNGAEFVLKQFSKSEQANLDLVIKEACSLITEFLAGDNLPSDTRKVL